MQFFQLSSYVRILHQLTVSDEYIPFSMQELASELLALSKSVQAPFEFCVAEGDKSDGPQFISKTKGFKIS